MTLANLGSVFGPNLLKTNNQTINYIELVEHTPYINSIIGVMLENFGYIFEHTKLMIRTNFKQALGRVIQDHKGQAEDELTYNKGDVIRILSNNIGELTCTGHFGKYDPSTIENIPSHESEVMERNEELDEDIKENLQKLNQELALHVALDSKVSRLKTQVMELNIKKEKLLNSRKVLDGQLTKLLGQSIHKDLMKSVKELHDKNSEFFNSTKGVVDSIDDVMFELGILITQTLERKAKDSKSVGENMVKDLQTTHDKIILVRTLRVRLSDVKIQYTPPLEQIAELIKRNK